MIYNKDNVHPDTKIIDEFTNVMLHNVLSIDLDKNCIYTYDSFNSITESINVGEIHCEWIDVFNNEYDLPSKFLFKRLTDA